MSDRKESILRTLQLQNEQLGEWEHKRTISRDPDEKRLCDDKIKDLKALIAGGEAELKKLKGGRQARSTYVDPGTVARQTEHNEIGFNADRHFSENNFGQDLTAGSFSDVGDEIDPKEITISPPTIATIQTEGNASMDRVLDEPSAGQRPVREVNSFLQGDSFLLILAMGLAVIITLLGIFLGEEKYKANPSKAIVIGIVFCGIIFLAYKFIPVIKALKFSFAMLLAAVLAGILFWRVKILDEEGNAGKLVGEIIIIPLIIAAVGVILTLLNDQYKKERSENKGR